MNKIKEIHSDVLLSLNKHNNTWLPLALKLNELVAAVGGKSKKDYWQKHFTVDSFYQYCKIELEADSSTLYKYLLCAEQIKKHRPDLIELYKNDDSIKIAGYTVFYELIAKKKSLREDVLKEILDNIVDDGYSRSQVEGKVYDSIAKKSKVKKTQDDDEKTQLISFDKLEGREVLYVLRIPEIKDEIKSFYEGVEDDELKTVELLIGELLKHLRNLSLRHEGAENAE